MNRLGTLLIGLGVVASAALVTCGGSDDAESSRSTTTTAAASTTSLSTSMATFVAAADEICLAAAPKVMALSDPDGVGGEKALGLGTVVQDWADELAALTPPEDIAEDWSKAIALLHKSGVRLNDSERYAAAGDPRSGEAQSEALWGLQAEAGEIILGLKVPFKACFVE
jgi:hypothetical protein